MEVLRPIYRWARANLSHRLIPRGRRGLPTGPVRSVEVVSYLRLASGVAEGARLCVEDLARRGVPRISCLDVAASVRKDAELAWEPPPPAAWGAASPPADARILHLNPPMLPPAILSRGFGWYRNSPNLGYWAWELDVLPREWRSALRYVDAVLAPSRFTAEAIGRYTDKPVVVVPHPVQLAVAEPGLRQRLGISGNAFLVSTIFSFGSAMNRKNPLAAVRAFRVAFGEDPGAVLVVKCSHAARHGPEHAALLRECAGAANIRVVDALWPTGRVSALLAESDAYLSLHRSEGFGLTIAESVLRRVPVVATAWSGNLDFLRPESSALVPATLVPVRDAFPDYAALPEARWAEADEAFAARALRAVRDDPEAARRRAAEAADFARRFLDENSYVHAFEQLHDARPGRD